MATFLDTSPDKIQQVGGGCYQLYFTNGQDPNALPVGTDYAVVYSPSNYSDEWYAVRYRIVASPSRLTSCIQVVKQRELEVDEIAYFEELILGGRTHKKSAERTHKIAHKRHFDTESASKHAQFRRAGAFGGVRRVPQKRISA